MKHLEKQGCDTSHHHARDIAMHAPGHRTRAEQSVRLALDGTLSFGLVMEGRPYLLHERLLDDLLHGGEMCVQSRVQSRS